MFDKVKGLYNLKKQADSMKKEMEQIFVDYDERGIRIVVRGDNHIEKVEVDGSEDKRLKDAMNDALKEVQKKVQKKMKGELSNLGIPGL